MIKNSSQSFCKARMLSCGCINPFDGIRLGIFDGEWERIYSIALYHLLKFGAPDVFTFIIEVNLSIPRIAANPVKVKRLAMCFVV